MQFHGALAGGCATVLRRPLSGIGEIMAFFSALWRLQSSLVVVLWFLRIAGTALVYVEMCSIGC